MPTTTNPYRGVSWHKLHNCWRVKIHLHGRSLHLGNYQDAMMAARIYDAASVLLRGPDAILNFSTPPPPETLLKQVKERLVEMGAMRGG